MKTSEMIAMLEKNPKLKFKNFKGDIETTVTIGHYGYFMNSVKRNGEVVDNSKPAYNFFGNFKADSDWQLVPEPISWQEALQAVLDGKTVVCENCPGCCYHDCEFKKKHTLILKSSKSNDPCTAFCMEQIQGGTWYIEESPNDQT